MRRGVIMQNIEALVKGALLHDIGKIVYRAEERPIDWGIVSWRNA